jgi:hypothetical protein
MVSVTTTAGKEKPIRVDLVDGRAGRMGSIGPMALLRVVDMRYATMERRATVSAAVGLEVVGAVSVGWSMVAGVCSVGGSSMVCVGRKCCQEGVGGPLLTPSRMTLV